VDLSGVRRQAGARTGLFVKDPHPDGSQVTYYRDRSAASQMTVEDVESALAMGPTVLHVSGVTPALSDSCLDASRHALREAPRAGTTSSFDVNYRPALWPSRRRAADVLLELAGTAHVVFVGLDEARSLWGTSRPQDVSDLLPGVESLVVKDEGQDAWCFGSGVVTVVPALKVRVREPVGAGDAFAAGWLHGLVCELQQEPRLRLGHLMARESLQSFTDHATSPLDGRLLVEQATAKGWNPT
jgi:2-dehydro-3-deoxygluconokinase